MNKNTTMTINKQKRILRNHVLAFLKHQRKATEALRAINEIGLRENEGNPFPHDIQGEENLAHWATYVCELENRLIPAPFIFGEFAFVVEEAQQAIEANGYIV